MTCRRVPSQYPLLLLLVCMLVSAVACTGSAGRADRSTSSADRVGELTKTQVGKLATAGRSVSDAKRIHDFIYASPGVTSSFLITTDDGNILVNTGMPAEFESHRDRFAAVSDAPLRAIFLTQSHGDHVGGVDSFREPGTRVIAQSNYHNVIEYWQRFGRFYRKRSRRLWGGVLGNADQPYEPPPSPALTESFDDRMEVVVGDRRFELLSTPGGETTDSLVVWMPEERIVLTGNLFGPVFGDFPALYTIRGDKIRSVRAFLRSLDRVAALEPRMLIAGHGEPIEGAAAIAEGLARIRAAVEYVYDETTRGMNEGHDVYSLMREIVLPKDIAIGEAHGKVSWGVRAIWEEHAGWFHYDNTAALYDVPPRAIWGELVELTGGADALVSKANAHLKQGEPVDALHLLNIAIAGEPESRAVLEMMHRALSEMLERAAGENFSEVRWLQVRLDEVQAQLDSNEQGH